MNWKQKIALACFVGAISATAYGQEATESLDTEVVNKIKQEGLENSQVMDTISYLTDVHGPRLTGSPYAKVAANWTVGRLTEWGLENAQLEPWGPFGRGWTLENSTMNLVEPTYSPIIAHVKAWSPSMTRSVRGVPIYLDAETQEDLEKFRGKLGRSIVLISPPRQLDALFEPPAERKTDEDLLRLANAGPPGSRRGGFRSRPTPPPAPAAPANSDSSDAKAAPAEPAPAPRDPRAAARLQADKWEMAYNEGAAVILEPGRGDGGNVFVASVTMPRLSDDQGAQGNPFSRGPRPWATEATNIIPQAVLAAEHYNRLVRMIEKGIEPVVEVDIVTKYYEDDLNTFNIIAEIPGTDLKDEIVMLGGHFDSWQAGTGATDNAVGCGVAMEAVRILKAIGVQPRRTIRLALWTGEEQGLLGSRAYVKEHFGEMTFDTEGEESGERSRRERPTPTYRLKDEQEKVSAYYNLDNGTGKIRGIYLQGNEALRPVFRRWLEPFEEMGASTVTVSNTGGTDHQSFDAIGIPGFQFIQDEVEYDTRTHHSSMDVFDRIQEEDVKQASIIMASFVYHTAMRDEKLTRKPLNGKVVKQSDEPTEVEKTEPVAETAEPAASEKVEIAETAEVGASQ